MVRTAAQGKILCKISPSNSQGSWSPENSGGDAQENQCSTKPTARDEKQLNLKFYYLRNVFCKGIAAVGSDSTDRSGQSKSRTFWRRFAIWEGCFKNICDSWEKSKIST